MSARLVRGGRKDFLTSSSTISSSCLTIEGHPYDIISSMPSNKLNDLDSKSWLKFQKSWFIHNPPPRKKGVLVHPAKFPETLAQEFIELFTKGGETVLDPMAGTGSTLIAALRAGRNSYGVELNPRYAEIANQMIAEERAVLGGSVENLKSEIIQGDAAQIY